MKKDMMIYKNEFYNRFLKSKFCIFLHTIHVLQKWVFIYLPAKYVVFCTIVANPTYCCQENETPIFQLKMGTPIHQFLAIYFDD